jgi:hypothetical protein
VKLESPVHGRYLITGQAFSGGQSAPFSVTVSYMPWGLLVLAALVALGVMGIAVLAVRRRQEGARRPSDDDGEQRMTPPGTVGEQGLPDPDPEHALS